MGEEHVIHVIALITAKPGQRDKILEAARGNLANVRAEDGCIEYNIALDAEEIGPFQAKLGPDTFVFVEKWRDASALKAHAAAPHMKEYGAKIKDFVANRAVHVLSPAG